MIRIRYLRVVLCLPVLCVASIAVAAESAPEHACDRMAADPADYERIAPPVADVRFLSNQAARACREALAAYPDDPRFQFQMGRALLALGKVEQAREALQKAAAQGYAAANLFLGRMFESASYGRRDLVEAIKYYRAAAEQGHQDAQIALGLMYRSGIGVDADTLQAFQWFRKAADQGNPHAHFFLGAMYSRGEHMPPGERAAADYYAAIKHFEIAAEAGIPGGQFALGLMYLTGYPVEKDTAKGLELMEAAAEQGFVVAAWQLGDMYMRGEDLPLDRERAIYWYCTTGKRGEQLLAEIHGESVDCEGRL